MMGNYKAYINHRLTKLCDAPESMRNLYSSPCTVASTYKSTPSSVALYAWSCHAASFFVSCLDSCDGYVPAIHMHNI